MGRIDQHIEIVSSSVASLSSMSETSRNAIQKSLSKRYKRVGITIVNNLADLKSLAHKAPDLVFLGMKFVPKNPKLGLLDPDKIWISEYLSDRGIATTGSHSIAHRLELSKPLAKKCISYAGLSTSEYYIARAGQEISTLQIPDQYPLFVKPADRGGGVGIGADSIVYNLKELKNKVSSITSNLGSDSLIERYLPGREFSVAILKGGPTEDYVAMPIELIAPVNENGSRLLGSDVKSADAERVKPVVDSKIRKAINTLALNAFRTLGGRDYGRIDIRMDEHGTPHFLEANLIPSLIDNYGSFPKACAINIGLGYDDMLARIVNLGLARSRPLGEMLAPATRTATTSMSSMGRALPT